jgi:hypothetical protein
MFQAVCRLARRKRGLMSARATRENRVGPLSGGMARVWPLRCARPSQAAFATHAWHAIVAAMIRGVQQYIAGIFA